MGTTVNPNTPPPHGRHPRASLVLAGGTAVLAAAAYLGWRPADDTGVAGPVSFLLALFAYGFFTDWLAGAARRSTSPLVRRLDLVRRALAYEPAPAHPPRR